MAKTLPQILIVDDEPDQQRAMELNLEYQARVLIRHPQEVEIEDLKDAHLVLVDYKLENWIERDKSSLSLKPRNGLGLTATLRSHINKTPTAFAIYTGHLADLSENLPPDTRPHTIARTHNLEWVFSKGDDYKGISPDRQIVTLAEAVQELPENWREDDLDRNVRLACELLKISESEEEEDIWFTSAWEDVEECHPPIHELSEYTHGLAFLRWLLHRILPYPCFVWDTHYLAARFCFTQSSLLKALEDGRELRKALDPFQYKGVLSGFLGDRWWRSGIESFLWEKTKGRSTDVEESRSVISSISDVELEHSESYNPIVCVDEKHSALNDLFDMEDGVRIHPDDWPTYADQAWTTVELAKDNPVLKTLVVGRDRDRVD